MVSFDATRVADCAARHWEAWRARREALKEGRSRRVSRIRALACGEQQQVSETASTSMKPGYLSKVQHLLSRPPAGMSALSVDVGVPSQHVSFTSSAPENEECARTCSTSSANSSQQRMSMSNDGSNSSAACQHQRRAWSLP
mmetsp:Transcript_43813/g.103593  ORF Transcript_43813/g.103593 Transcript_43813/m.103593 type:complete len:142 (-) Transcript_43813:47-472(-)